MDTSAAPKTSSSFAATQFLQMNRRLSPVFESGALPTPSARDISAPHSRLDWSAMVGFQSQLSF